MLMEKRIAYDVIDYCLGTVEELYLDEYEDESKMWDALQNELEQELDLYPSITSYMSQLLAEGNDGEYIKMLEIIAYESLAKQRGLYWTNEYIKTMIKEDY